MSQTPDNQFVQAITKKYANGFVIENCIIKGEEKTYPMNYKSIGELILKILNRTPERIVQIDAITGLKKTYKDLKEHSVRLALWMEKEAIGTGDIVLVCSSDHPDIHSIIFATLFIGATYATIPYHLNLESARRYINHIKPRIILASKNRAKLLQEAANLEKHDWKMIYLDEDHEHTSLGVIFRAQSTADIFNFQITSKSNLEQLCVITPTSGTTGNAKFTSHSYGTCMRWISSFDIADANVKNLNKITLTYLFPEWLVHFEYILKYFLDGSTRLFHANFDPDDTCSLINMYKVDALGFSTYNASILCQSNALNVYDLQSVTLVIPMGTKLFATTEGKLRNVFQNAVIDKSLGLTETRCLTKCLDKYLNPESSGTVEPNVQLKIADVKTGTALEQNQVGEICAKAPYMMTGYYKDPIATKLAYDNEGWYRTGDEGYYDENGEVVVIGRLKEMIRFRHVDIHPFYIEQILLSHSDIVDAAVVGINHAVDIEHPVAFVKIKPGSNVTEEDILNLTSELEYSDTFKDSIIFIDEIPRSTNGKINRRVLKERAEKV